MKRKIFILTIIIIFSIALCCFFRVQLSSDELNFPNEELKPSFDPISLVLDEIEKENRNEEIDWDTWKKRNSDIYAWIRIPDTKIDYPVLQSTNTEDGFYLTHDIDRESNIYGAIYTETCNSKTFKDSNTIVYGHNMRDESMFGSLKSYSNLEYFDAHRKLLIFTPKETRVYEIVAAYHYQAVYLPSYFDFTTESGMDSYLSQIPSFVNEDNGQIRTNHSLKTPLLTLSTCTSGDEERRFLVQAILIDVQKEMD